MGLLHLAALIAATVPAGARPPQAATLNPGDMLSDGEDRRMKVRECRTTDFGHRDCKMVGWEDGRATSTPAWWPEKMLVDGDARVREHLGLQPRVTARAMPAAPRPVAAGSIARPPRPAAPPPPRQDAGGRVPDGSYKCQMWMGNAYVDLGRERSVGGRLTPDALARAGATITGVAPSKDGITISYITARGYRESLDCARG